MDICSIIFLPYLSHMLLFFTEIYPFIRIFNPNRTVVVSW